MTMSGWRQTVLEHWLKGCRILVVEDEYLIADDLRSILLEAGAEVLGPVPNVEDAASLIEAEQQIDGALLDINLNGTMAFNIADTLVAREVPFVFATGYDQWAIPDRFALVPRLEKPIKGPQIFAVLAQMIQRKPCLPPL